MKDTKKWKLYETYMIVISTLGQLPGYAQAYKIFILKSSEEISLLGLSLTLIAIINWIIYAVKLKNLPLIISNSVGLIGTILLLVIVLSFS